MEQDLETRLKAIEEKVDKVFVSAEKTRKYFLAVLIITVIAFVLPLVGLIFAIPSFIGTYTSLLAI